MRMAKGHAEAMVLRALASREEATYREIVTICQRKVGLIIVHRAVAKGLVGAKFDKMNRRLQVKPYRITDKGRRVLAAWDALIRALEEP